MAVLPNLTVHRGSFSVHNIKVAEIQSKLPGMRQSALHIGEARHRLNTSSSPGETDCLWLTVTSQSLVSRSPIKVLGWRAGLTLAQQARLYSKSDVLVAMHGAASGNLWALPKNAVYVEVRGLNMQSSVMLDMQSVRDSYG